MPARLSPADLTWDDLDRIEGETNPGLLPEIGRIARRQICSIYQDSPGALGIGQKVLPYVFDAREALLSRMCNPLGLVPPAPTTPFIGGQCPNVLYEVRLTNTETRVSNEQFVVDNVVTSNTFYGPIRGVRLQQAIFLQAGGVTLKTYKAVVVDCNVGDPTNGFTQATVTLKSFTEADKRGINELGQIQITRIGGPDNCGNPDPIVPSNPPNVNNFNTTANLTINNNVAVSVPVTVIPTLIAPVGIVVRPEFNVDVGGVRATFDLGGVTFNNNTALPPGTDIIIDPRPNPPTPANNTNNVTIGGGGTDLTGVLDKLDKIQKELEECCDRLAPFPEPKTDEYDVIELPHLGNGKYIMPSRTFTVTVEVAAPEGFVKTIEPAQGPTVYFCGWAWFKSQGGLCTRQPLDALRKAFKPPERADNEINVSFYAGYTGTVKAWYAKADA